jgi:hypothetical protein
MIYVSCAGYPPSLLASTSAPLQEPQLSDLLLADQRWCNDIRQDISGEHHNEVDANCVKYTGFFADLSTSWNPSLDLRTRIVSRQYIVSLCLHSIICYSRRRANSLVPYLWRGSGRQHRWLCAGLLQSLVWALGLMARPRTHP